MFGSFPARLRALEAVMRDEAVDLAVLTVSKDMKSFTQFDAAEVKRSAECMREYGLLRVRYEGMDALDIPGAHTMLRDYFSQPEDKLLRDAHPELGYEVGYRPPGTEQAHAYREFIDSLPEDCRPVSARFVPPPPDPKHRWFEIIAPESRAFFSTHAELNSRHVVRPEGFHAWTMALSPLAQALHRGANAALAATALGMGLYPEFFTELLYGGPHLFGPTACHPLTPVQAYVHRDIGCVSMHLPATHKGARFYTRGGKPFFAQLHPGEMLAQAADQMETLTGGEILAGFHEVVAPEDEGFAEQVRQEERLLGRPTLRIALPAFFHARSSAMIGPRGKFRTPETMEKYGEELAGTKIRRELNATSTEAKI